MYISKQNEYYIQQFYDDDWNKPYLDFNYTLLEKKHTDQIEPEFKSFLEQLQIKFPDAAIENHNRNSMCCYILRFNLNKVYLSIWISLAYPCYVILDFSSFDLIRRRERPTEIVPEIEVIIKSTYWDYQSKEVQELQKLNSFPVGYLNRKSTISHVVFGGEIGMW